ncbi:hypothetical protein [Phenylobacterium sp.]|jgi:hypothetical protein|uniref:hypothetical protein n=1 Tax=Phenylobacterium sp. TaxID=1871053 RepID=UPI0039C99E76
MVEQPCSCSGLLSPGLAALEDEVGGLDKLSQDGDDDDLGGFASGEESLGEGFQSGVATAGL